jgi:quercetin dioxygenase-like cupin family protein
MKSKLLFTLMLLPALALAQDPGAPPSEHVMRRAADLPWGEPPPSLPPGSQVTILYGDPKVPGAFGMRIKAPPGYKIPRHWHVENEIVTVISGDFTLSMGEAGKTHEESFVQGDFISLPAKMQHEASTKGGAIVQVTSTGPFEVHYVNPSDDPRNAKKAR